MVLIANFHVKECTNTKAQIRQKNEIRNALIHHVFPPFFARASVFSTTLPISQKNAHGNSVTNFSSVRDFSTIKNLRSCANSSSTKLFPHLRLLFRTFTRMYMYFWLGGCPSLQQSGLSLLLLCASLQRPFIPCPLLPHRLESTLLGVKDLLHILSVSRGKRLWETDLQNCPNHSWHSVRLCVHPRFAEQNNIRS